MSYYGYPYNGMIAPQNPTPSYQPMQPYQPERRPSYGASNGSNLVNELERVMAQETNQRKLDMYQQMLDLAHQV